MRPGGRVIVIEALLGEMGEPGFAPFSDLNMMVIQTGRERTLSEYRELLKQAGFRLDKSSPIRSAMAVIWGGGGGVETIKRVNEKFFTQFCDVVRRGNSCTT